MEHDARESCVVKTEALDNELGLVEIEADPWPEVSNSIARTVIEALSARLPAGGAALPEIDELAGLLSRRYGLWLRSRLERSGIAQRLPGGIEAFPDLYSARSELRGAFGRHFRPRTHAQLALHILDNLDWFLDPAAPARPRPDNGIIGLGGALLALCAILAGGLLGGLPGAAMLATLCLLLAWRLRARREAQEEPADAERLEYDQDPELQAIKPGVQAAEFYRYLVRSYSDDEDDGGLGLDLVGKLREDPPPSPAVPEEDLPTTLAERRAARQRLLGGD